MRRVRARPAAVPLVALERLFRRRRRELLVQHDQVPQHRLVEPEAPAQLGRHRGVGVEADQRVDALALLVDLVGQAPAAPLLDLLDLSALRGDHVLHALDVLVPAPVVERGIQDVHGFIRTNHAFPPSVPAG